MPMIRHTLQALGVTIAFTAGALITALVLDINSVEAYLGLAAHDVADWYRDGPVYLGIAALTGLLVDAARFAATKLGTQQRNVRRDIERLFRQSLA
jgi:hypothetical protein